MERMNHPAEHSLVRPDGRFNLTKRPVQNEPARNIRIAIADDEPLARRALRRVLNELQETEVVGEYSNGDETIEMIPVSRPDILFLDVEMPGINGLELARRLDNRDRPLIVFVTAYDQYALEAFQVQAVDYVLKPISEEKVREVMNRVRVRMGDRYWQNVDARLDAVVHMIERQKNDLEAAASIERLTIKNQGRIYFVEISSIDWIQAEGNYVTLHTGSKKHLLRIKMNQIGERLNPKIFIRIHRSIIVNIRSITELRSYFNGSYLLLLKDTTKIFSSRGYKKNMDQILNHVVSL
jgi:two-component system, LytTR family, response regulator